MKTIWKLTAWHWRLVRVPYMVLCAVYAIQQAALLLVSAANPHKLGWQMAELFQDCGQMPLFFTALYLVAILAASATRSKGKNQQLYTLYTMPFSRRTLWMSQLLLAAILAAGFVAWQILLYVVLYFPVTLVLGRVAAGMVNTALPWNSLMEELNANPLMQLLLPVKPGSGLTLLGMLLILSLHSACVACCHGLRRAVVFLTTLLGMGAAYAALYLRYHLVTYRSEDKVMYALLSVILAAAVLLAAVNVFQASRALKRAETA